MMRTFEAVLRELVAGLEDGSVVLGPPCDNAAELARLDQRCEALMAERDELHRLLEATRAEAGRLWPLAALVSGVLCDARDVPVADTGDVSGLHAGLRQLLAERDAARAEAFRLREALCDVIGLVSRAVAATTEPE